VASTTPQILSQRLFTFLQNDPALRSQIISIGIPILLPDGKSMLRAETIKIPPYRGEDELPISQESINLWAHDGWVDLRESNMKIWRSRFIEIVRMVESIPDEETSSRTMHNSDYWNT